jgi:hypothetical protein
LLCHKLGGGEIWFEPLLIFEFHFNLWLQRLLQVPENLGCQLGIPTDGEEEVPHLDEQSLLLE